MMRRGLARGATLPGVVSMFVGMLLALASCAQDGAADVASLEKALDSKSQFERRAAVRELAWMGKAGEASLRKAMDNPDVVVRKAALQALSETLSSSDLCPLLDKGLSDKSESVRMAALNILVSTKPRTPEVEQLLKVAAKDKNPAISVPAKNALWPFYKKVVTFRERPDVADHLASVKVVLKIELPPDNWKFMPDPNMDGHLKNWFARDFDDKAWREIKIGKHWDDLSVKLIGVAWHRGTFKLPDKPDLSALEIHFGAVDESAWVWVNGRYAGQHDIGPGGWDKEFSLDISDLVEWGGENQITVRVLNTALAGGIWKPVYVEALKL